jgi:DNA transformation protein and related proteins
MPADESFHAFVKELFAGMGPVQIRRMFGGAGVFRDGLMFALLANDAIHIKANDDALKNELIPEGSGPFVWIPSSGPRKGEAVDLGYWRLPDSALDDPDEAVRWGRKALALAQTKARAKPKKTAKKQPSAQTPAAKSKTKKR